MDIPSTPIIPTLTPDASEFMNIFKNAMIDIKPGRRVHIVVPRSISHERHELDLGCYNWDELEEIQMNCRGPELRPNVFVVLRWNKQDESEDVVIDICHV